MATRIKLRRDTGANWTDTNPILALGEPGFETETNKLKIGDGVTPWRNLDYVDDTDKEDVFVMTFSGWPVSAASTSRDGLNWSVGTPNTWNNNSNYANIDTYDVAVGGGRACYLVYNYNVSKDEVWTHETQAQALTPVNNDDISSGGGDEVWWQRIKYENNKFVAVGYYYDLNKNNYYYPAWAYSDDGVTWTRGAIDIDYIENKINYERDNGYGSEDGIYLEDVVSNGEGWLFYSRWDYYWSQHATNSGIWFLTNLNQTISDANGGNGPTSARYGSAVNMGWIAYDNNRGEFYWNTNSNPLVGVWSSQSYSDISNAAFGSTGYCWQYHTSGKLNGTDYFIVVGSDGRWAYTTDFGTTWNGVVPDPKTSPIAGVSFQNPGQILVQSGQNQWWNYGNNRAEKITISGATGINGNPLSGTYYVYLNQYFSGYFIYDLYHDAEKTNPVDTSNWTGDYDSGSATVTWTYGEYLTNPTYGNNTIVAIDNNNPKIWTTNDLQTWKTTYGQFSWEGPWSYEHMAFGTFSNHNSILKSVSNRVPGYENTLSLGDDFYATVINGDPINLNGPSNTYFGQIGLQAGNYGYWGIAGGGWYGDSTSINSYDWNDSYDSIELRTWNNSFYFVDSDGNNNNNDPSLRLPFRGDIIDDNYGISFLKDLPQHGVSGNYTLERYDRGTHLYNGSGNATYTIPTNGTLSFPLGTSITIVTSGTNVINVVAANSGTTTIVVPGVTYSANGYNIPINSVATLLKIENDRWILNGYGITAL